MHDIIKSDIVFTERRRTVAHSARVAFTAPANALPPSYPILFQEMFSFLSDVLASSPLHVPTNEPHGSDTCRRAVWAR